MPLEVDPTLTLLVVKVCGQPENGKHGRSGIVSGIFIEKNRSAFVGPISGYLMLVKVSEKLRAKAKKGNVEHVFCNHADRTKLAMEVCRCRQKYLVAFKRS